MAFASSLEQFNWKKIVSYFNPQSVKDLDQFLDNLPARAGMNGIIVASIIWAIAGASLLFVYTKSVDIQEMQKEMTEAESMRPTVPMLVYKPLPPAVITPHIVKIKALYPKLQITQSGNDIKIISLSTREFPAWRAAINDIAYGSVNWRAQIKGFCTGRECDGGQPLQATLTIMELDIIPAVAGAEAKS